MENETVNYLHHALGKHGLNVLSSNNITKDKITGWVTSNGITTVHQSLARITTENNMNKLGRVASKVNPFSVVVSMVNFIEAFGFEGFTRSAVNEFKVGIFNYLLTGNEKFLSQLKGARLKAFLNEKDKIADAQLVLKSYCKLTEQEPLTASTDIMLECSVVLKRTLSLKEKRVTSPV
jgi:hypothetical protein